MSAHTPGPWEVDPRGGGCIRTTRPLGTPRGPHYPQVALATDGGSGREVTEVEANTRLIAAAPDLLTALKLLEDWATATVKQLSATSRPEMLDRIRNAREAIAKAGR